MWICKEHCVCVLGQGGMCAHVCTAALTHVCVLGRPEVKGNCPLQLLFILLFWVRVLHWSWILLRKLAWLVPAYLVIPVQDGRHEALCPAFLGVPKISSSCLCQLSHFSSYFKKPLPFLNTSRWGPIAHNTKMSLKTANHMLPSGTIFLSNVTIGFPGNLRPASDRDTTNVKEQCHLITHYSSGQLSSFTSVKTGHDFPGPCTAIGVRCHPRKIQQSQEIHSPHSPTPG